MKIDGYSSDELKSFHRILQAAMAEANARRVDFPVSEMIERLFSAADRGERDPAKLRSAVLAGLPSMTMPAPKYQTAQAMRAPIIVSSKRRVRPRALTT